MSNIIDKDETKYKEKTLEWQLLQKCISERNKKLIPLLFDEIATQATITFLTEGLNPDKEDSFYMLLLGSVGFKQGWQFFQPLHAARFRGLHRYYQARNITLMPWLAAQLNKLDGAGIKVMLLRNTAMQMLCVGESLGFSTFFDIAVPQQDFQHAEAILSVGYNKTVKPSGRVCLSPTSLPESRFVRIMLQTADMHMGYKERDIWKQSKLTSLRGTTVYMPTLEDIMLSIIYYWPERMPIWGESYTRLIMRTYQSMFLLKKVPGFSIEKLLILAKETNRLNTTYFWCRELLNIIPDLEAERILMKYKPEPEKYWEWLNDWYTLR